MVKKFTEKEFEERCQKRKAELTKVCRYYKDNDIDNPWQDCYNPNLIWRKEMWQIEKEWVEALSKSYKDAKYGLIKSIHLEDFFKSCEVPVSLMNNILIWAKSKAENDNKAFKSSDAILTYEKYIKFTPIARDYRMYFAYFMGEEYDKEDWDYYLSEAETFEKMGYSQERIMSHGDYQMRSSWYYANIAEEHRGAEGIWGWYADSRFPAKQKDIVFFMCCNWGRWCPYDDVDALGEEYLFYHYPGDDNLKETKYGDSPVEDVQLSLECEEAAVEEGGKVFNKSIDVDLYKMYDEYCYFKIVDEEEDEKYPRLIKVQYADYHSSVLSKKKSKTTIIKIEKKAKMAYIKQCLIYKGEENNPYDHEDFKHWQWEYEETWAWNIADNTIMEDNYINEFLRDFPDGMPFDKRPLSFKAFMYSYLTSWNDYPVDKEAYREGQKRIFKMITDYLNMQK